MKNGVLPRLPFQEYLALPAINKSGLDLVEKSPLHYWAACVDPERKPREPTPAMLLGSAIHTAVLEPERFLAEYREKPRPEDHPSCLNTVEQYKAACRSLDLPVAGTKEQLKVRIRQASTTIRFFDDLEAELANYKLLNADEISTVTAIRTSVRDSLTAQTLLTDGAAEQTIVWIDDETGVPCKARADWLSDDRTLIADLKSTKDASPAAFSRSCAQYNYHRQAAWYLDGVLAACKPATTPVFAFIAYETDLPWASAFYSASPEMIRLGRAENRALLRRYAQCLRENRWPGYDDEIQPLDLPAWRKSRGTTAPAEAQPLEVY